MSYEQLGQSFNHELFRARSHDVGCREGKFLPFPPNTSIFAHFTKKTIVYCCQLLRIEGGKGRGRSPT